MATPQTNDQLEFILSAVLHFRSQSMVLGQSDIFPLFNVFIQLTFVFLSLLALLSVHLLARSLARSLALLREVVCEGHIKCIRMCVYIVPLENK